MNASKNQIANGSFGDNPIYQQDQDWLHRQSLGHVLANLIIDQRLDLPLTIGVYGDWGSGKTSILHLIRNALPPDTLCLWFNAWAYAQQQDALWRAFLLAIVRHFRDAQFQNQIIDQRLLAYWLLNHPTPQRRSTKAKQAKLTQAEIKQELNRILDRLEVSLYRSQSYYHHEGTDINGQAVALLMFRTLLRLFPLGETVEKSLLQQLTDGKDIEQLFQVLKKHEREELINHVQSIEQFKLEFEKLLTRFLTPVQRRLVILIDDLDRCLPEQAISVLEAIKIFFDTTDHQGKPIQCVFVLGMDRRVIEDGLRTRYHNSTVTMVDARSYLDKIIQIPFSIPPLTREEITEFAEKWCDLHEANIKPCASFIATGVAENPRSVKRTLNILTLLYRLRQAQQDHLSSERLQLLTKLVVIQTSYDEIYRQIVADVRLFRELELASHAAASPAYAATTGQLLERHPRLRELLRQPPHLPSHPDEAEEWFKQLFYGLQMVSLLLAPPM
ncbi:MAG: KAP family P-loop NTPase fold protein [Oscillochloridaceae bacterium umkhey_bin13]